MSVIQTQQLSFQLDTGEWLIRDLNVNISERITGLVGRNGVGKSVLLSLLCGRLLPTKGSAYIQGKVGYYSQVPSKILNAQDTIAQFLGISEKIIALKAVQQGSSEQRDFDAIQDDWEVESRTRKALLSLRITNDLETRCTSLSGGQLAILQLYRLFNSESDVLLLDEPTNHLDSIGREWLINRMASFAGSILLVSHDRELLNHVEAIYHLSTLGMEHYSGNYDFYLQQYQIQENALNRRIVGLKTEQKKIERQAQRNKEKMEQREAQGNRLRKSGSQPKVLLDGKKNKAEQSKSSVLNNNKNQLDRNKNKLAELQAKHELFKVQAFYLQQAQEQKKRTLLRVNNCKLNYGSVQELTVVIAQTERVHLDGYNGCGKSTFLQAIHGTNRDYSGEIDRFVDTVYLDQHFGVLDLSDTVLESVLKHSDLMLESTARTLLAGIGFRRDTVFRKVRHLSGGEKMKLSMLMVSHIKDSPLLLLDEPDNHLDIESKKALSIALNQYCGAFILVSHDPVFIGSIEINKRWEMSV